MSEALSDEEVFGPAPSPLSDAEVFGPKPKPLSDADLGMTSAYWGAPRAEAPKPTRMIDILRHPIIAATEPTGLFSWLGSRAGDTLRHATTVGAGTGLAADAAIKAIGDQNVYGPQGERDLAATHAAERASRSRPAGSALEHVLGFGADVAGSLPSPESWVAAPAKWGWQIAGRPVVTAAIKNAAVNAGVNLATDPLVQGAEIARGQQEKYNYGQTAMAPLVGAALGGAIPLAGHAIKTVADIPGVMKELKDHPMATGRARPEDRIPALGQGPVTVDALWGRLLTQEHGTDKDGNQLTSPKGAKGPAQLMPDTAEYVANKMGRPDLAKLAMGEGELANVANEILGKTYLNEQLTAFDGDPVLSLAAYNAGPGKVREWVKTYGHPDEVGRARWLAMVPFKETRDYVHNILGDVAGAPHALSPGDHAYMRGRLDEFPHEQEIPLQPIERAGAAADEADRLRAEAQGPLPGDPDFVPTATFDNKLPWDQENPGEKTGSPLPKENPESTGDLTDQALDHMRSGKRLVMGEGPTLIEALVKAGGIQDADGEIAKILGGKGENRLQKMLRKVNTGMSLSEAAEWAKIHGYLGDEKLVHADTTDPYTVHDTQALLDAIDRELRHNEPTYAEGSVNEHARALRDHVQNLEEVLAHIGMDPKAHTNGEIRQAMDAWMREADMHGELEPGALGMMDTGEVLGMGGRPAMATGAEAVARARRAAREIAWRNEIMATTKGGFVGSRSPGAVAAPRDAEGGVDLGSLPRVRGVPEIVRRLGAALGYPVRQGRIAMRRAAGTYSRKSGMVRSKGRYDLNVLAHEFGHALEFTDGHGLPNVIKAMKAHAGALKKMDYNQDQIGKTGKPPEGRRHEGFAEWFRWYITNPAYADTRPGAQAFRTDFEAAMAKDAPEALAAVREAQADYQAFLDAPSLAATREHVITPPSTHPIAKLMRLGAEKGPFGALKDVSDEAYRGVMDFLHPWKQAVDFAMDRIEEVHGVRPKLAAAADPYKLLRSMASVAATGHMDLLHGVHGYHSLEPDSPSFVGALTLALGDKFFAWDEGAIRDFGTYLTGRRVVRLYDKVGHVWTDASGLQHGMEQPPDALSRKAWQQTVDDLEAANPQWAEAADLIYQWNSALWRKRHESGLIGEQEYLAGLEDHPDYVPLFRDISDKEFGGDIGGQRGTGTKNAGGVVQLKGSDRAYINPLHSMMNMAYELNTQIARNDALKALDDLGQIIGPDIGQVVERIKAHDIRGTSTSVEEVIANAAKAFGVSRRDAAAITDSVREMFGADEDDALAATVYRAKATGENGEPIVYVWRDGERIPLRLPDGKWGQHMVEGLAGMTQPIRSVLLDIAAIPAMALRAGVTAHPAFFLANSFRDQMTAFVLTDVGYRPFVDQAAGLRHEVGQHIPGVAPDELTRIYNVVAGEIGGFQTSAAHQTPSVFAAEQQKKLQALRPKGKSIRHFATWDGFAHFTEVSESGTRLGIFERALKDAKARGFSDYAAAKEAAFAARDYMDFDRHGAWATTRVLARVIPFMNAGLQALDKTRRVAAPGVNLLPKIIKPLFGQGPPATPEEYREFSHAMKLWITAGVLAVGGLAIRAAYKDDPEYQEVADTLRNTHWVVKLPDGYFGAIPKPYEIAVLSNIFERAFEATAMHDPSAWGRLTKGLEDIFIPAHDPAFAGPIIGIMRNRTNLGAPVVPQGLEGQLPRDQYTDRTSEIAKWLGSHMGGEKGLSPAQIDYLAKQWGGSNMRDLLDANTGRAPAASDLAHTYITKRFVKDWTSGAISTKEFYDLTSSSDGQWAMASASVGSLINDGKYGEAVKRLQDMKPAERAYVMINVFGKGEAKQDHPMVRAQAAAKALQGLARDLSDGDVRGPDLQPIKVTPEQRRDAIRSLHELSVAEQRNAMIMAAVPGWEQREPLAYTRYLLEFQRAAPQLVPALIQRFKDEKVRDGGQVAATWGANRKLIEAEIPADQLTAMMQVKRFPQAKSGDPTAAAMKRAMSDVVPVPR